MRKLIHRLAKGFPSRKTDLPLPARASIPQGTRVYAIGDIHGRADLLEQTFAKIDAHNAALPIRDSITVFLGDYVDRGLRSSDVLDMLIAESQRRRLVALCGNHEEYMLRALSEPDIAIKWLAAGGRETLYSYNINTPMKVDIHNVQTVMAEAKDRIPETHKLFLGSLMLYSTIGGFGFVHAGIRPGIALEGQSLTDITSIREPFLNFRGPHDYVMIHGHTPVSVPDFRSNRINIDTGAYITGKLTCLVLEGTEQYVL